MFVSHQWAAMDHPDPNFDQFEVLQGALRKALSGETTICADVSIELYTGQQTHLPAEELRSKPLFIWYDYFACPQDSLQDRELAISSIPAYVDKAIFFVILCPHVHHRENQGLLSKRSWESRGWCRLERATGELSAQASKGFCIEIQSSVHQFLAPTWDWVHSPVGEGEFTFDEDRQSLLPIIDTMLRKKLHSYLLEGDFHHYRLLLNLQSVHLRGLPIRMIEDLVPGFATELLDPAASALEKFMYQNGLSHIHERNEGGWSPICYAAISGNPMLLASLLDQKADVNDGITQVEDLFHFNAGTRIVHMCAHLRHNDALRLLIGARADLQTKDGWEASAIHWAALAGNAEGIQILRSAGCSPTDANLLGYLPFTLAAMSPSNTVATMQELLQDTPSSEIDLTIFCAMLHANLSAEVVSLLIDAGADVNHRLSVPFFSALGVLFAGYSLKHRWKSSTLSTYAYHHEKATPLMCSIITSSFEATAVLIAAGARTDLQNARGFTATALAEEVGAPAYIIEALKEETGPARAKLVTDFAEMVPYLGYVAETV
ncbi:Ankrd17 [Symbiodinium microadriaticum]|nr:Ankrd17 [Symbiodinium microadriaticum]